ncbi:hypothetical protein [Qipengyuania sp. ASV99]
MISIQFEIGPELARRTPVCAGLSLRAGEQLGALLAYAGGVRG